MWCPSPGGANSAAPPPRDRWLGPLFVGYPVLAQQWDELFGVFVGKCIRPPSMVVDGNRGRDEVGEAMRPFGFEEEAVAGTPDDEGGCCECG